MRQTRIEFHVGGDSVEGVMCGPVAMRPPMPAVVVCHPHPVFGGSMDSPLVFRLCEKLAEHGIASMRFNFRRTAGDPQSMAESAARDAAVAFDVIRQWDFVNSRRCAIAGYSFGAAAILRALPDLSAARGIALIAPPPASLREARIGDVSTPLYFVVGDRDKIADPAELQSQIDTMTGPVRLDVLDGADHALTGHIDEAADRAARFLADALA